MTLLVEPPGGSPYEFELPAGVMSRATAESILTGRSYPALPFLDEVRVVVDAGANSGAASVYFACHHPDATVHAVEPASATREVLLANVRGLPNVVVHPIGLYSEDKEVPLYLGDDDSGTSSIVRNDWNRREQETIRLRDAAAWAREQGIDRIDVLKVDVELCELEVIGSLRQFLPETSVVYFEYGHRDLRRGIDRLLDPTHDLYLGEMSLDQGECVYLRRDLAARPEAKDHLWQIYVDRAQAKGAGGPEGHGAPAGAPG